MMQTCTGVFYDRDGITNHQRRCLQISKCGESEWNIQTNALKSERSKKCLQKLIFIWQDLAWFKMLKQKT